MAASGVTELGLVASGSISASGTTLTVTFAKAVPIGTFLYMGLVFDNSASTTAPTVTIPTIGGVTLSARNGAAGSGVTTTSGAGIWMRSWSGVTTAAIAAGATFQVTFGTAIVAKACAILGLNALTNAPRGTVTANASTAGNPSGTTAGTALVEGDVVIGLVVGENNALPNPDSDTLNGIWSTLIGIATNNGGAANTNVCVGIQWKQVTATGAQVYNPTLGVSADSLVATMSAIPVSITEQFSGWGIPI